ncbi:MAG: hypothetical protein AABY26_05905, partial [Nanoarchaeota archaeon]
AKRGVFIYLTVLVLLIVFLLLFGIWGEYSTGKAFKYNPNSKISPKGLEIKSIQEDIQKSIKDKSTKYYGNLPWTVVKKEVKNITYYGEMVILYNETSKKYYSGYNTSTFDTYFMPNKSFRIVCEQPCPIPEIILRKKVLGANIAIEKMLKLIKLDVTEDSKPVDIHLTTDMVCKDKDIEPGEGISGSPFNSSFICARVWDNGSGYYPINPSFTNNNLTLAGENAMRIEGQFLIIHEYSHIIFYDRTFTGFGFMGAWAAYVSGVFDNTGNYHSITTACDPLVKAQYEAEDAYLLCTNCGFDFSNHSALLLAIDEIYSNGKGKPRPGFSPPYPVGIEQTKEVCDKVVGKDCVKDCGLSTYWLGK